MKEYDIAEIGKNFELTVEPIKLNYMVGKVKKSITLDLNKLSAKMRHDIVKDQLKTDSENPFTAFDAVDVMASKVEAAEFRKAYDTDKMSIDDFNAFNFAIYAIIVDFPLERASS